MATDAAGKWRMVLTGLGIAAVLVGWGVAWANQNARIMANKASIEAVSKQMENVSGEAREVDKAIVRMETKIEYIVKGIDEIRAEMKGRK
ncbi:MAG: hypothetical protein IH624_04895 [Phycisphaerae bacterium]|nr:hypothetical protein [Phycisphaerae bacterium]